MVMVLYATTVESFEMTSTNGHQSGALWTTPSQSFARRRSSTLVAEKRGCSDIVLESGYRNAIAQYGKSLGNGHQFDNLRFSALNVHPLLLCSAP